MSRITDTVEDILDAASSIEEIENCDINEIFISSLPGSVLESKTDEERKLCSLEFSDLSIDCSEEKDISKVESKNLNLCEPLREIDQQETRLEFCNEDFCADGDLLSFEKSENFEICDLGMITANIESLEIDSCIGETQPKSSSDERKQDCINCDKSTQTFEESAENFIELKNSRKNYRSLVPLKPIVQNPKPTLEKSFYLNRFNIADDFSKQSHLNIPVREESSVQPSQETEVKMNQPQVSEDSSNATSEAIEVYSKLVAISKLSKVMEKGLNQSAGSQDRQPKIPEMVDSSSTVPETSNSATSISKIVTEDSTVSEDPSRNEISRNVDGISRKDKLLAIIKCLDHIISIVDKLELMNNRLMKTVDSLFKKQQILQELINMVYEQLVRLRLLPSQVIFVHNEYTVGHMNLNVQQFGEYIFEKLKTMKTELNGTFRECSALRMGFGYVSRKICSIPFELTEDHALESTLDRTVGLYSKVCRIYKKRKRFEIIGEKITSETLSMVLRAYEFGDYIDILIESLSKERLV